MVGIFLLGGFDFDPPVSGDNCDDLLCRCVVAVAAALLPASRTGKGVGFGTAVGAVGGAALVEALGRNGVSIDVSRSKL